MDSRIRKVQESYRTAWIADSSSFRMDGKFDSLSYQQKLDAIAEGYRTAWNPHQSRVDSQNLSTRFDATVYRDDRGVEVTFLDPEDEDEPDY